MQKITCYALDVISDDALDSVNADISAYKSGQTLTILATFFLFAFGALFAGASLMIVLGALVWVFVAISQQLSLMTVLYAALALLFGASALLLITNAVFFVLLSLIGVVNSIKALIYPNSNLAIELILTESSQETKELWKTPLNLPGFIVKFFPMGKTILAAIEHSKAIALKTNAVMINVSNPSSSASYEAELENSGDYSIVRFSIMNMKNSQFIAIIKKSDAASLMSALEESRKAMDQVLS